MAVGFSQWGNDLYTGKRSYDIVGKRKRFYIVAILVSVAFLALLLIKGFNLGIEFRGGSQFTINNAQNTEQSLAVDAVTSVAPEEVPRVTNVGSSGLRVQTAKLDDGQVEAVREALIEAFDVSADNVSSSYIGPSWGADVSGKAIQGLIVFLILVTIVMSLYFRAWRMAVAAIIALFHDLIVTAGIYALIGWEVTPATVIGFLTILGYSIYDTVVVFDKVRENTHEVTKQTRVTYAEQANLAVNQTLVRSINTSVVALLPVASILFIGAFILGAGTLRDIALALFVGMAVGTYSSIFLATPLEVSLQYQTDVIKEHDARVKKLRAANVEEVVEGQEGSVVAQARVVGQLQPGQHLGAKAQPKRKRKRK